jgi:uncharacterized protein (DUF1786 family)
LKILAIDIGAGTEDVMLYDDSKKSVENCVKMVLPSASNIYAECVKEATRCFKEIFVKGDTIGGGAFSGALKKHIEAGLGVYMTEKAAFTVRNCLDQVKALGIKIVFDSGLENFYGQTIILEEVNINQLRNFIEPFGESFLDLDFVAVAVQDHGVFPKGMTNRHFRINKIKELLKNNPRPEAFAYQENEIPKFYPRMHSAVAAVKRQLPNTKVIVMDTSLDAIIGCLIDPAVEGLDPILAVNIGNGHTMAAIISGGEITAVLEHHTRLLDSVKMEKLLRDFADGKISNKQVFEDNGHGMFCLKKPPGFSRIKRVVVTGPNRNILEKTSLMVHFATPGGDVMMSGTLGLVEAIKRRFFG